MREAIFASALLYASLAVAGGVAFLALLASRDRWLAVVPIWIGVVAVGMAPGACEHSLPTGTMCTSTNPGGGAILYFVLGFFYAVLGVWITRGVIGIFAATEAMKRGIWLGLTGMALLSGSAGIYFSWRDSALAGARTFVASAPEVVAHAFTPVHTSLAFVRRYSGVPGKKEDYREYEFRVAGPRGLAYVTVRVRSTGQPKYQLVSVK